MNEEVIVKVSELRRLDVIGIKRDGDTLYGIVENDAERVDYDDEDGKGFYWDCNVVRFEGAHLISLENDEEIILEGKASEKKLERTQLISMVRFMEHLQMSNMFKDINE